MLDGGLWRIASWKCDRCIAPALPNDAKQHETTAKQKHASYRWCMCTATHILQTGVFLDKIQGPNGKLWR